MIVSTTYLIAASVGLYECPVDGLTIAGTFDALYLLSTSLPSLHASSTGSSKIDCFLILLLYLVLGREAGLFLNLSGSRGFLILSFSSSTMRVDANVSLTFSVC